MQKIKVTGKAQNSTALGIMHAYVQMFPKSTLADMRRAFPNEIAPDQGVEELFLPLAEAEAHNSKHGMSMYFVKDARPIILADGKKIALAQIWSAKSLNNLVEIAGKLDISAEVDKSSDKDMGKSGYVIEYLNGWSPAAPKKGCLGMLALLLMAGGGTLLGLMKLF